MLKVAPFLEHEAEPTCKSLQGDVDEAIRVVEVVANDFGDKALADEDNGGIKMFVLLKKFLGDLDRAAKDNECQRVAALKAKASKARGLQTRKKVALAAKDKNGRPQSIREAIKTKPGVVRHGRGTHPSNPLTCGTLWYNGVSFTLW